MAMTTNSLVDLRLVSRPSVLASAETWQNFKFQFESMMSCVAEEYRDEIALAVTRVNETRDDPNWPAETKKRSATLYATLASLTTGAPLNVVRSVGSRTGYEAWRRLIHLPHSHLPAVCSYIAKTPR